MVLSIGVAAAFFGVVFVIVGWKGGGTSNMNSNLVGMVKGNYLPANNSTSSTANTSTSKPTTTGATSTTGGANASQPNPTLQPS
jgi:hypothetical protein